MGKRSGNLAIVAALTLSIWASRDSKAQSPQLRVDTAGKTAVQAYKNITILKDIPADQLLPSMQFISASLGVECEFCHVERAFEKDDKKEKQTAREMLTMMFAINKENFQGRREVTCNSCHHGSAQVAAVPAIPEEPHTLAQALGKSGENPQSAAAKPSADQVIDKYLQAIGGADALAKVNTLVE